MSEEKEQDKKKGFGGFLRRMLKGVWFVASALIVPLDIKFKGKEKIALNYAKVAIYSLAYFVIQPASTFLLPTAEKILAKNGINPELVQELAPGKKIYVREDNLLGNLHTMMDKPLLFLPFNSDYWNSDVQAYARPWESFFGFSTPTLYVKDPSITIDTFREITKNTSVLIDPGKCFPSASENFKRTILHEVRHCSDDNMRMESVLEGETDADYRAIGALARELGKPSLPQSFVDYQALFSTAPTHDDALYLDAVFNKRSLPSFDDIRRANKEAAVVYDSLHSKVLTEAMGACDPKYNMPICNYDAAAEIGKLSSLGQRRAELYNAAVKKFMVRDTQKDSVIVSVPVLKPGV
jgi:hypothetical protein